MNSTKNHKERINQLLRVSADDLDMIFEAGPGSVCCIVELKHTVTGDTLLDTGLHAAIQVRAGRVPPVYALSIEPERSDRSSQQKELEQALNILSIEDPSL
jgi:elongation factor G